MDYVFIGDDDYNSMYTEVKSIILWILENGTDTIWQWSCNCTDITLPMLSTLFIGLETPS